MSALDQAWQSLSKATQLKEAGDLEGAIKVIHKAKAVIKGRPIDLNPAPPAEMREIYTKLAYYYRLLGDYDAMLLTIKEGYESAISWGSFGMNMMEASILISRLANHLGEIAKDKNHQKFFGSEKQLLIAQRELSDISQTCRLESQKLLVLARAEQNCLDRLTDLRPRPTSSEALAFAKKHAKELKVINDFNSRLRNDRYDPRNEQAEPLEKLEKTITDRLGAVLSTLCDAELIRLQGVEQNIKRRPRKKAGWKQMHIAALIVLRLPENKNHWLTHITEPTDLRQAIRVDFDYEFPEDHNEAPQHCPFLLPFKDDHYVVHPGFNTDDPYEVHPAYNIGAILEREFHVDSLDLIESTTYKSIPQHDSYQSDGQGLIITVLATKRLLINTQQVRLTESNQAVIDLHEKPSRDDVFERLFDFCLSNELADQQSLPRRSRTIYGQVLLDHIMFFPTSTDLGCIRKSLYAAGKSAHNKCAEDVTWATPLYSIQNDFFDSSPAPFLRRFFAEP